MDRSSVLFKACLCHKRLQPMCPKLQSVTNLALSQITIITYYFNDSKVNKRTRLYGHVRLTSSSAFVFTDDKKYYLFA